MTKAPADLAGFQKSLGRVLGRLDDTHDEYVRRQEYQDGRRKEIITHPDIEKLMERYADAFQLGYAAVPANALADRVDITALRANDETLSAAIQQYLWEPNDLDDDADDWHHRAMYLGDWYVIAWPSPDTEDRDLEDGEEADPDGGPGTVVELQARHPLQAVIIYRRDNSRLPEVGGYVWKGDKVGDKVPLRANLYFDDAVVELISPTGDKDPAKFVPYLADGDEDGDHITYHEWGFNVFHFRPDGKPYGVPVNRAAYGPQDAITKINATEMGALDYMGYPQRWATLDPAAEVDDDIAEDFQDGGAYDDEAPTVVARDSKLKSAPGSTFLMAGVKQVGQFEAADTTSFLASKTFQIKAAATLTRTPMYEFDLEGEVPSGEARRRADGPINKHAKKCQGTFGQTWSNIGAFAARVWNIGESKKIEAVWMPPELANDKDGLEVVQLKVEAGIPPRQALLEAGYTPDQVDLWIDPAGKPVNPGLLVKLGDGLQKWGQAKTLGSVTSADIAANFAPYLEGERPEVPPMPQV